MPLRTKVRLRESVYDIPRFSRAYELRKKNGKNTPRKACRSVSSVSPLVNRNQVLKATNLPKKTPQAAN